MGHRMHRRPSWNYCTYRLISLAFISGSIVLYASYLCLSLIYCLTHVKCFRFFLSRQHYRGTYKLQTTSAVLTTTTASVSSMLQKRGRVSKSCHTRDWRNHPVWSKFAAGLRPAWDLLLTCFWHACDTLTQACDQVYDQVCSWLEWCNADFTVHLCGRSRVGVVNRSTVH